MGNLRRNDDGDGWNPWIVPNTRSTFHSPDLNDRHIHRRHEDEPIQFKFENKK